VLVGLCIRRDIAVSAAHAKKFEKILKQRDELIFALAVG